MKWTSYIECVTYKTLLVKACKWIRKLQEDQDIALVRKECCSEVKECVVGVWK